MKLELSMDFKAEKKILLFLAALELVVRIELLGKYSYSEKRL